MPCISLLEFPDAFADRLGIDLRFPISSRLILVVRHDAVARAGLQVYLDVQGVRAEDAARALEMQRDAVLAGRDRIALCGLRVLVPSALLIARRASFRISDVSPDSTMAYGWSYMPAKLTGTARAASAMAKRSLFTVSSRGARPDRSLSRGGPSGLQWVNEAL